jgi:hypothetical protein
MTPAQRAEALRLAEDLDAYHTRSIHREAAALLRTLAEQQDSSLLNLLAIIHRDGGHYVEQHGIEKATDDAHEVLYQWRGAFDALAEQQEPNFAAALYQYRWTNPGDHYAAPEELEWKPLDPRGPHQTLQQRIEELQAYRYEGKKTYIVRALYTAPVAQPQEKASEYLPWLLPVDAAVLIGNMHRVRVGAVQAVAKQVYQVYEQRVAQPLTPLTDEQIDAACAPFMGANDNGIPYFQAYPGARMHALARAILAAAGAKP